VGAGVGLPPRGGARMAGTSRMSREAHVRICGGLEVRFLRSTRQARSGHTTVPLKSKFGPSDGCGRGAILLAAKRWYNFRELGAYLGNLGSNIREVWYGDAAGRSVV